MPTETWGIRWGRERIACALFALCITLLVGVVAAIVLLTGFKHRVEESARRDAMVIGTSVARSLAGQFEKAARYGIPLKLLPGVETYLASTLQQTPGLTRIILRGPDGREVRSAIGPVVGNDTVNAPVLVDGIQMGQVDVTTTPATLSDEFSDLTKTTVIAVILCSVLAAGLAWVLAGNALARNQERLTRLLARNEAGEVDPGPPTNQLGRGVIAEAFQALSIGARRLADRQATLQAYADELLAVDFDGRLRPEIKRVTRDAMPRPTPVARPQDSQ
ncbi:MAG: hypothetical protein B7Z15_09045 [Rhizobiales bacterium 32-66-8]|jgi:hypothetical protein|nr:MAG: hypothetical protein B7Z15_09045 [Rhizobiales bacterium 32-66-8]